MTSLLDRIANWIQDGDQTRLHEWAHGHASRKRRRSARAAPRRKVERASRSQREANWQTTRAAVLVRSELCCEMCGRYAGPAVEVHHLAPGPLRRRYEAPTSCIAACLDCHRAWHRGEAVALSASRAAAKRIGAPDVVLSHLRRRIQRVTR